MRQFRNGVAEDMPVVVPATRPLHGPEVDAAARVAATAAERLRTQLKDAERVAKEAEARRKEHVERQASHMAKAQSAASKFAAEADALIGQKMVTPLDWLRLGENLYAARERLMQACRVAAEGAPEPGLVQHVGTVAMAEHATTRLERVLGPMWLQR